MGERPLDIGNVRQAGKGRAYLIVYDSTEYESMASDLFEALSESTRCLLFRSSRISDDNWEDESAEFQRVIAEQQLRHFSIVSFGAAATLAQYVALMNAKSIRSLVLVDGSCRAHPSAFQRFIDRVENWLPLGLPLRRNHPGFDGMPFLHRVRCPVLVVTREGASRYQRDQARYMKSQFSTAWLTELEVGADAKVLGDRVLAFQTLPVKCPQKNVKSHRPQMSEAGSSA